MKFFKQVCLLQKFMDRWSFMEDRFITRKSFLDYSIDDRSVLSNFINNAYSQSFINSGCFAYLDSVIKWIWEKPGDNTYCDKYVKVICDPSCCNNKLRSGPGLKRTRLHLVPFYTHSAAFLFSIGPGRCNYSSAIFINNSRSIVAFSLISLLSIFDMERIGKSFGYSRGLLSHFTICSLIHLL